MIAALRTGILMLVIPPTLMSLAMILFAYSRRNKFRESNNYNDQTEESAVFSEPLLTGAPKRELPRREAADSEKFTEPFIRNWF